MTDHLPTGDTAALSALLRPRSIGDILDTTIRLYRRYFLLYFGIVIIMQAIVFIVSQGFQIPFYTLSQRFQVAAGDEAAILEQMTQSLPLVVVAVLGFLLLILVSMVAYQFTTGGLVVAVSDTFLGHEITIGQAYEAVLGRFWSLLGAGLLSSLMGFAAFMAGLVAFAVCLGAGALLGGGVMTALGVLMGLGFIFLAVVAAIYIFLSFMFAPQAVMLEGAGAVDALRRSWELMWHRTERGMFRNNIWRAGILLTIVFLISGAVVVLLQVPIWIAVAIVAVRSEGAVFGPGGTLPLWIQVPSQLLQTVGGALVMPVSVVAMILFYYDIRIRFEGYDLQVLSSALEAR